MPFLDPKQFGAFPKLGVPPHNKDDRIFGIPIMETSILGSILGSPCFGKQPFVVALQLALNPGHQHHKQVESACLFAATVS